MSVAYLSRQSGHLFALLSPEESAPVQAIGEQGEEQQSTEYGHHVDPEGRRFRNRRNDRCVGQLRLVIN